MIVHHFLPRGFMPSSFTAVVSADHASGKTPVIIPTRGVPVPAQTSRRSQRGSAVYR